MENPTNSTETTDKEKDPIPQALAGLKLRGIGPALMGGRIADIAVHPHKSSTWYVAVGSGNLWKTTNAGITWQPVFDKQTAYSIGCVTLDPTNPETVWVGTGENVSGRHVGWGDGVYRSLNGGRTWQCMGLENSQHIGKILVDPRDGRTVYVAAEGPLWSAGGDRGVYKTSDGGQTWTHVLALDEHTGVTDIVFDPANPDTLYAAAYQRRRHIYSFMGGGPGSGIYKSTDAGATWRRITEGLPKGDMGKIGLAVTPADPELVYATIEANEEERGFYRSPNRGESWEKRNKYISGGTGPHYYQKIMASPTNPDLVYQMDVFVNVTRDGGKTFKNMETGKEKHSDNHAFWIDPDDGQHLLIGCDAGLYESFDEGGGWRHFPNLPVSQFYRVDVDNSEPFFNILGGAQDLGTLFGPSRTMHIEGVRNQDWYVPLGADGYHVAFDPDDPQTFYLEYQNGNSFRYDRRSMELIDIKPFPEPGEAPERWNWDAPIVVSPHNSQRVYVASQRVWRSEDRGGAWTAVSPDLTRHQNRYELPFMGRVWSVDDLYDTGAMSQYATITHLCESPLVEGLLYAGTDDGLIQVSEDGGASWREAAALPGVPEMSLINNVKAAWHDTDTVYAIANAHQIGDFSPYLFVSRDRGRSWESMVGDLPEKHLIWAIEQDHVNGNLLFIATEFGLFFTVNGGRNWHKLGGNVPTIAFRDVKLQRRDGDLVGASFGRGFYVLDDYAPLREINDELWASDGHLFPVRDAWWYVPYQPMQAPGQPTLGTTSFKAANPDFGAIFTYFLREEVLTAQKTRQQAEKKRREAGEDIPFPGWERLRQEAVAGKPRVLLLVRNEAGEPVRWLEGATEAGLHRASWDLRRPSPEPINLVKPEFESPWSQPPRGPLAAPGRYSAELWLVTDEGIGPISQPQSFVVKAVPTLPDGTDVAAAVSFQHEAAALVRQIAGAGKEIERTQERLRHLAAAVLETPGVDTAVFARITNLQAALVGLAARLLHDEVRDKLSEPSEPTIQQRARRVFWGLSSTRQMPTATQQRNLALAEAAFAGLRQELTMLIEQDLDRLEMELAAAGAPWTPGRRLG
ncbi:MAG: glycosyl hydrolase [Ardenticatenaceae bacterium]|nr:glycosyl hydrolase [Ardenticatenaceae bacterium]